MSSPTQRQQPLPQIGASHPRVRQYLNVKSRRVPGVPPRAAAIEGLWALRRALDAGVPVEAVFVCAELVRGEDTHAAIAEALRGGARVYAVSRRTLDRLTDRDGPDGIAAIVHIPPTALDDVDVTPATSVVVLDRIELAGNLGAIIRCADGAGVAAVVLTDRRTRLTHPVALKASMGTVFSVPVVDATTDDAIAWLRRHRFRLIAADPAASTSYRDASYAGPVAIVLGSERYGLAPAWKAAADELVSIPMLGTADSLNVGHAAALFVYEALMKR